VCVGVGAVSEAKARPSLQRKGPYSKLIVSLVSITNIKCVT